jgi:hypothetical protein
MPYTTQAKITAKLPATLPTTFDAAYFTTLIADASGEIDDMAGVMWPRQFKSNVQKFPDITDSPATPKTIELCTIWLALAAAFEDLGEENRGNEPGASKPNKVYYRELAEAKMDRVAAGTISLYIGAAYADNKANLFGSTEKYPDDETDLESTFTNDAIDELQ